MRIKVIAITCAFTAISLLPPMASAQTPANDNCAGAVALASSVPYVVSTVSATKSPEPESCSGGFDKGVWFTYTPVTDGIVIVDTCGSTFATALAVYTGSCGLLTQTTCGYTDGGFCSNYQMVSFVGQAGVTYYLRAGSYWGGESGTVRITATGKRVGNDDCAGAIALTNGLAYQMSTLSATITGDGAESCSGGFDKGVWFTYTAPANGPVVVDTCGSSFYTSVMAYTGNCGVLSQLACGYVSNALCANLQVVSFTAQAGVKYYLRAGSYYYGEYGMLRIRLNGPAAPPSVITSVSPNPVMGANVQQPLFINGANFVAGCTVILRDLSTGEVFANPTIGSLTLNQIVIHANFTTAAHSWSVEVVNPVGSSSGQFQFQVVAPVQTPTITGVSPNPVTGSPNPQPFTIHGNNFAPGCNVTLRDLTTGQPFANRAISAFSANQMVINPTFTTEAHNWSVEVINPNGALSGQFKFSVVAPGSGFFFSFPLQHNGWTPYTATISSVFDHSMSTVYCPDGMVTAYTGETGTVVDPNEPPVVTSCGALYSYKKLGGGAFTVNGHYAGTSATGATTLNYDGHPGIDFPVPVGTAVFAAAAGEVVVADSSNSSAAGNYVRLQHTGLGYQSQYLHLSEVLVSQGQQVAQGQLIGRSGNSAGQSGNVSPHLHFEAKRLVGGQWISVDPYGWAGAGADPYKAAANVNLWNSAGECVYTVSPVSRTHGPSAGSASISITAGPGCGWTASSTSPWITLTSSSSGSGSGNLSYSVAANPEISMRTGFIVVQGVAFTVTQTGTAGLNRVYGVDVSSVGQGTINPEHWGQVKAAGKTFAWIRASKGNAESAGNCRSLDPKFYSNVANAKAAGLVVGAYHAGNVVLYPAVEEARFFVSVAGDYIKPGYLRPVLDLESHLCGDPATLGPSALSTWVDQWAGEVRRLTGVTPIIYCSRSFISNLLPELAQKYDLWVANFTENPESVVNVAPWSDWAVIQYSENGAIGGIPRIDLNVFRGTMEDFQNRLVIPMPQFSGVGGGELKPPRDGQFQFEVASPNQQQVIIQASDDLVTWVDIGAVIIVNGKATFTDFSAGSHHARFYRAKP
ncbi:MAG: peptidoglycan DD-metalloendopeptidase family protein [Verrucomicrobia bacterium]|nr:peptidoglycan DD-metalloendopeptidase family protein [Verrucomicrobiota bacterium]